jgi:O-antigen/teichoic acid export membrane protein
MSIKILHSVNKAFAQENTRSQKAKRNIVGSLLSKGGSIAIGLFLIPLTIHYVSPPQYGIWLTLSSIVGWFSFFDIGFGHGLRNKFAEAVAKNNVALAKTYVSTTYAVLAMIVAVVLLLFISINPFLNWTKILNAPEVLSGDLRYIALVVLGFFCMQMVLQLISTVVIANQQPAIASFITFSGNFIALIVIFLLTRFTQGNLFYIALALSASPVLAFAAANIWLFTGKYRRFAPSFKTIELKYARNLMSLGAKFFVLQVGAVILFQTNNIIINQLFGPEQVTSYNIAYRYFGSVYMLFGIIISPFWSASTEAWIKQDIAWIKGIIRKLKNIFLLLSGMLLVMLLISKPVYNAWIGSKVIIPFELSLMVALCTGFQIWQGIFIQFLNGISKVMLQLYVLLFFSAINIPLAIFLGKRFGISGVVLSSVLIFAVFGSIMFVQAEKIINNKAKGIWNR